MMINKFVEIIKRSKIRLEKSSVIFLVISVFLQLYSYRVQNYNLQVLSVLSLLIYMYVQTFKYDKIIFMFFILFQVFLVNRPVVSFIWGEEWWTGTIWMNEYDTTFIPLGINLIYFSIVSIYIGYQGYSVKFRSIEPKFINSLKTMNARIKRFLVNKEKYVLENSEKIFYLLCFIFFIKLTFGITEWLRLSGAGYEHYYLTGTSNKMNFFYLGSQIFIFVLTFYLVISEDKFKILISLVMNVLSSIPDLSIGLRSPFVLSVLLIIVYVFLFKKKIFKRTTKYYKLFLMLTLGIILFYVLDFINSWRHGLDYSIKSPLNLLLDILYKQGFTFNTHIYGLQNGNQIHELTGSKNYVFGELIRVIKYNPIGQRIFDLPKIPAGNSIEKAVNGYWFSHILAYVQHPRYLEGFGYGTSYLTEAYHVYGLLGVFIINYIIGKIIKLSKSFYNFSLTKRWIYFLIIFNIMYLPRQSFTYFFSFLFKPYFYLSIFLVYVTIYSVNFFHSLYKSRLN